MSANSNFKRVTVLSFILFTSSPIFRLNGYNLRRSATSDYWEELIKCYSCHIPIGELPKIYNEEEEVGYGNYEVFGRIRNVKTGKCITAVEVLPNIFNDSPNIFLLYAGICRPTMAYRPPWQVWKITPHPFSDNGGLEIRVNRRGRKACLTLFGDYARTPGLRYCGRKTAGYPTWDWRRGGAIRRGKFCITDMGDAVGTLKRAECSNPPSEHQLFEFIK